jgi:hypothetical protein
MIEGICVILIIGVGCFLLAGVIGVIGHLLRGGRD